MTYGKYSRLYQAYRDDFDLESMLKNKGIRYADLDKELSIDDVIPL